MPCQDGAAVSNPQLQPSVRGGLKTHHGCNYPICPNSVSQYSVISQTPYSNPIQVGSIQRRSLCRYRAVMYQEQEMLAHILLSYCCRPVLAITDIHRLVNQRGRSAPLASAPRIIVHGIKGTPVPSLIHGWWRWVCWLCLDGRKRAALATRICGARAVLGGRGCPGVWWRIVLARRVCAGRFRVVAGLRNFARRSAHTPVGPISIFRRGIAWCRTMHRLLLRMAWALGWATAVDISRHTHGISAAQRRCAHCLRRRRRGMDVGILRPQRWLGLFSRNQRELHRRCHGSGKG